MPLTLKDTVVVDLSQNIAGPYCAQLLGDFGAAVYKIERPQGGDDVRRFAPMRDGTSAAYFAFNRNKKSAAIDITHPDGLEAVRRLAARADVFIHSLKPSSARERRLGYEETAAVNSRIIYCAISGFGAVGPRGDLAAYDPLSQAYSGLVTLTGHPHGDPVRLAPPVVDMGCALWAFGGIMAGLLERISTGRGARIETSLVETAVAWTTLHMAGFVATGKVPERSGSASPAAAPYEAFRTADGWLMVAAGNDRLYRRLCELLEAPELLEDSRFSTNSLRVANRAALHELLEPRFKRHTTAHWFERLALAGVPASPLHTLDEVYRDEQVRALKMLRTIDRPGEEKFEVVDIGLRFNGEKAHVGAPPPRLGEHTDETLSFAGYDAAQIAALKAAGAVLQHPA